MFFMIPTIAIAIAIFSSQYVISNTPILLELVKTHGIRLPGLAMLVLSFGTATCSAFVLLVSLLTSMPYFFLKSLSHQYIAGIVLLIISSMISLVFLISIKLPLDKIQEKIPEAQSAERPN
jgi:hypothetical protein